MHVFTFLLALGQQKNPFIALCSKRAWASREYKLLETPLAGHSTTSDVSNVNSASESAEATIARTLAPFGSCSLPFKVAFCLSSMPCTCHMTPVLLVSFIRRSLQLVNLTSWKLGVQPNRTPSQPSALQACLADITHKCIQDCTPPTPSPSPSPLLSNSTRRPPPDCCQSAAACLLEISFILYRSTFKPAKHTP